LSEVQKIGRLAYIATSIGLVYILVGLFFGFYLAFAGEAPRLLISSHSHLLCMSTIIVVVGVMMKHWERELELKKFTLKPFQLRSAQVSVILLALGAIVAFISFASYIMLGGIIGYVLYFIGILMVTIGYILGSRKPGAK